MRGTTGGSNGVKSFTTSRKLRDVGDVEGTLRGTSKRHSDLRRDVKDVTQPTRIVSVGNLSSDFHVPGVPPWSEAIRGDVSGRRRTRNLDATLG